MSSPLPDTCLCVENHIPWHDLVVVLLALVSIASAYLSAISRLLPIASMSDSFLSVSHSARLQFCDTCRSSVMYSSSDCPSYW